MNGHDPRDKFTEERIMEDWTMEAIEKHLASGIASLTPDIWDKLDTDAPQDVISLSGRKRHAGRRLRKFFGAAAACALLFISAGSWQFYQNNRVDSRIGIDVNPSIELEVNRNRKVLDVEALNEDARVILDDMDLKKVDLKIAVNALVGSMVRHGYLDDLDNAILVTVSGGNTEKNALVRQDVVADIENSLEEHRVQAVVYNQQADETDEVRALAEQYGISYGKAYFLKDLVEENDLTAEEMTRFSGMTMEEIAAEIAESSYSVKPEAISGAQVVTTAAAETKPAETVRPPETTETEPESTGINPEETEPESPEDTPETAETAGNTTETADAGTGESASAEPETVPEREQETRGRDSEITIDNVDYEDGVLNVEFEDRVKWKTPAVSVQDEDGTGYAASITDTSPEGCEVTIRKLPGGLSCTFTISGIVGSDGKNYRISGYFDTPVIDDEDEEDDGEEDDDQDQEQDQETASLKPSPSEADPPETGNGTGEETPPAEFPAPEEGTETLEDEPAPEAAETGSPEQENESVPEIAETEPLSSEPADENAPEITESGSSSPEAEDESPSEGSESGAPEPEEQSLPEAGENP